MIKKVEKPWGHEIIWAQTNQYIGKILHIKSGHRLSRQYHQAKDETVYVLEGTLYNYDGEDCLEKISKGESLRIMPHQIRRFCANDEDVTLIEVSTHQIDDVIRLDDDYGRSDDNSTS